MRASLSTEIVRLRVRRTIGLSCVLGGMLCYRSFSDRAIFGRWSATFVLALMMMAAVVAASALSGRRALPSSRREAARRQLFDLGVLLWGAAYLIGALDDPVQGGRLLDFNFFGSVAPPAAALEWLSMLLFMGASFIWLAGSFGSRFGNAILAAGTAVLVLLVGEGAARAWTLATATTHLGYASQVWQRRFVQRNSLGARDVEHDTAASGRRRLLVVGDSYAFGWGVKRIEDRFGERLAARLSAAGESWEAINVSEPDKHLLEEFAFLRDGLRYKPDLIVDVYVFNDIDYLMPVTPRPMVAGGASGIHRFHPLRLVYANSYLFQELYARLLADAQRRAALARSPFAVYDDSALVARHLEDLARFVAIADSAGVPIVIAPLDPATGADSAARWRYDSFVDRVRARGLPIISIAHAFDGVPIKQYTVSSLDGHPNAIGHRLAAEAAAPQLLQLWSRVATARSKPVGERSNADVRPSGGRGAVSPVSFKPSTARHESSSTVVVRPSSNSRAPR